MVDSASSPFVRMLKHCLLWFGHLKCDTNSEILPVFTLDLEDCNHNGENALKGGDMPVYGAHDVHVVMDVGDVVTTFCQPEKVVRCCDY